MTGRDEHSQPVILYFFISDSAYYYSHQYQCRQQRHHIFQYIGNCSDTWNPGNHPAFQGITSKWSVAYCVSITFRHYDISLNGYYSVYNQFFLCLINDNLAWLSLFFFFYNFFDFSSTSTTTIPLCVFSHFKTCLENVISHNEDKLYTQKIPHIRLMVDNKNFP